MIVFEMNNTTARNFRRGLIGFSLICAVSACSTGNPDALGPGEFNDPYEAQNRKIHEFNKSVDTAIYKPVSYSYGKVVPVYMRERVNNVSETVDLPRRVLNSFLQGDVGDGMHNAFRFTLNATIGMFGIFDFASGLGIEERDTDFGETLHTWGVGEGVYLSVPFFGPYTQRDLAGDVVDIFTNPLSLVLVPPQTYVGPATTLAENADYRYEFRNTLEEVLYESADSYAQSRVIYLENRRFELGESAQPGAETAASDPFEELYGD
ncbi:MAG: MlaA family lipoprotein [Mangrovicoccus sp.]